jgi:hypothetical protein
MLRKTLSTDSLLENTPPSKETAANADLMFRGLGAGGGPPETRAPATGGPPVGGLGARQAPGFSAPASGPGGGIGRRKQSPDDSPISPDEDGDDLRPGRLTRGPPSEFATGIDIKASGDGDDDSYKERSDPNFREDEIDTRFFAPLTLDMYQMWGPTMIIVFFLGILIFVLMWLYVYISFNSYRDRITVLSMGNLFNQSPQKTFQSYIQQATQESIAAAMQDITTSGSNVQATVNRLQTQMDVSQTTQQGIDAVLQPIMDWLQKTLGQTYMSDATTVKKTA